MALGNFHDFPCALRGGSTAKFLAGFSVPQIRQRILPVFVSRPKRSRLGAHQAWEKKLISPFPEMMILKSSFPKKPAAHKSRGAKTDCHLDFFGNRFRDPRKRGLHAYTFQCVLNFFAERRFQISSISVKRFTTRGPMENTVFHLGDFWNRTDDP